MNALSGDDHFVRLANMYHSANVNQSIPSCLTVQKGQAEVHMRVSSAYWHSAEGMHGCVYFKGLDDAAFFAANSMESSGLLMTAGFEVTLMRMVSNPSVKALGYFERREGRKLWARSELFDDHDNLVAKGSGLFIVSDIELMTIDDYRG